MFLQRAGATVAFAASAEGYALERGPTTERARHRRATEQAAGGCVEWMIGEASHSGVLSEERGHGTFSSKSCWQESLVLWRE